MITLTLIYCLILIILIHELGHLAFAKLYNVGVKSFSIGFGPKLVGFKYKGTEYKICILLLGGYCELEGELDRDNKETSYLNKRYLQKVVISLAGIAFNLISAMASLLVIIILERGNLEVLGNFFLLNINLIKEMISKNLGPVSDIFYNLIQIPIKGPLIFFATLSFITALINLVPFPPLDGSAPIMLLLEKYLNKINKNLYRVINFIGFYLVMFLQLVLAIYIFWEVN